MLAPDSDPDKYMTESFQHVEDSLATTIDGFAQAAEVVGGNITTALTEVATELGGEELARHISELAAVSEDSTFPNPAALGRLEELVPGSAQKVIERSVEIGATTRKAESRESGMVLRGLYFLFGGRTR